MKTLIFKGVAILLIAVSFAFAGGTFELTVKQWNDFKKRPLLLSGESVMWRVKIWNSWRRYDYGNEIVIQTYLMPHDKLNTNKKEFPVLVICDRVTKFTGTKFDPKFNPNFDPTYSTFEENLDKNDILTVQGRLACIDAKTGIICMTAGVVVDEGSK